MRAFPTRPIILAALSAFERRISAEKATRRNGSVWLHEGAAQTMMSSAAVMPILYIESSVPSKEHCDFR